MFELIKNLHATAWYRNAQVCLSKWSLFFPPFLKRQAQLYIIYAPSKTMADSAACIIHRTTNANLFLQGLETAIKHTETSGNARLEVKQ